MNHNEGEDSTNGVELSNVDVPDLDSGALSPDLAQDTVEALDADNEWNSYVYLWPFKKCVQDIRLEGFYLQFFIVYEYFCIKSIVLSWIWYEAFQLLLASTAK